MKSLRSLLLLLIVPLALRAAPVDSKISAVTVYTDRAVVTRTAQVDLTPGLTELVFANLPESLNERSLQVSGSGSAQATILDVSAKQTYVDFTPNARVKELEDQLKALGKQMRGLEDRGALLGAQTDTLVRLEAVLFAPPTKDTPRPELKDLGTSLAYLAEQRAKIVGERASLDEQKAELTQKIAAVEAQLSELRGSGGRAFKTVTVRLQAAQAGRLDLALAYTVPGAGWTPGYDARVTSGERAVAIDYFGLVRQSTGEDWSNVALTLSTARPSLGGAAPVLSAWNLDVWLPRPMPVAAAAPAAARMSYGANDARQVNMQTLTSNAAEDAELKLESFEVSAASARLQAGATSAAFKIAVASTVPSDNSPQKVPITSAKLAANPEYLTVPKRQATAFLTAKVVNSTDYPLLGGAMNVFLDGTFVATSNLRTVMAGEKFDLALGADEGIAVKHKRVQRFAEETGFTSKTTRITYEYLITIQNNKRTAERVIVADQIPLSRNEKIVIKQVLPDPKEAKPTDEGTLKWTLDLKPGEKRDLTVKFTVEHPNDVNVSGLN